MTVSPIAPVAQIIVQNDCCNFMFRLRLTKLNCVISVDSGGACSGGAGGVCVVLVIQICNKKTVSKGHRPSANLS